MSNLTQDERRDLQVFFAEVVDHVTRAFGETIAFEHGARLLGSATGCGVDQAHVHIVPIPFKDLWVEVSASHDWQSSSSTMPGEIDVGSREYLWLTDHNTAHIAYPRVPTSQFFRRAISQMLGLDGQWDYREYPFHEHIYETRLELGSAAEQPRPRAA